MPLSWLMQNAQLQQNGQNAISIDCKSKVHQPLLWKDGRSQLLLQRINIQASSWGHHNWQETAESELQMGDFLFILPKALNLTLFIEYHSKKMDIARYSIQMCFHSNFYWTLCYILRQISYALKNTMLRGCQP